MEVGGQVGRRLSQRDSREHGRTAHVMWTTLTDGSSEMNLTAVPRQSRVASPTAAGAVSRSQEWSTAYNAVSGVTSPGALIIGADGRLSSSLWRRIGERGCSGTC